MHTLVYATIVRHYKINPEDEMNDLGDSICGDEHQEDTSVFYLYDGNFIQRLKMARSILWPKHSLYVFLDSVTHSFIYPP